MKSISPKDTIDNSQTLGKTNSFTVAKLVELFIERTTRITVRNKQGEIIYFEIFIRDNVVFIYHTGDSLETGQIDLISIAFREWWIGLHWFIKTEDKSYKVPRKGLKKPSLYEPMGIYLKHIFMLCEACKARERLFDFDLPSVSDWFWSIWEEIIGEELFYVLSGNNVKDILELKNIENTENIENIEVKKDRCLKRTYIRKHLLPPIQAAASFENPYYNKNLSEQQRLNSGERYRETLLECSIKLSEPLTEFNTSLYKPFIAAWRNSIAVRESPEYKMLQVKRGDLYVTQGKALLNLSIQHPQERYIDN